MPGSRAVHGAEDVTCDAIQNYNPSNLNDVRVIGYSDRQVEILQQALSDEKK